MIRRALTLFAAAALAGCPLPQPLPDYPPGTITPPRIPLSSSCPTETCGVDEGPRKRWRGSIYV
jgi:hypothetical protein